MHDYFEKAKHFLSKQSVDAWELFWTTSESFKVEVRQSHVDSFKRSRLGGMSVRVINEGSLGFSFCSLSDMANIEKTIINAVEMAGVMPADELPSFSTNDDNYAKKTGLLNQKLVGAEEKDKIEIARIIENEAYKYDSRITVARSCGYSDSITSVTLTNSLGLDVNDEFGVCSAWVELMAEASGEQETAYWFEQNRDPFKLDPPFIAHKAAKRAIHSLGGKTMESGNVPAIFENITASGLLSVLSNSFVAENHFKRTASPIVTEGAELFSKKLKITDDGGDTRGEYARSFDGEGSSTQRTVVVDHGVVNSWLYDRYYGAKFNHPSTGNSLRSGFELPPNTGTTNFYVEPGHLSLDEMIAQITNGILITEVMGLHTANPVSGDFSLGISGFKITNGNIDHPVKGIAIAGNLIDLFKGVSDVGNDFGFFGNIGACSLLCENICLSGS